MLLAPTYVKVIRVLLNNPGKRFSTRELAKEAEISPASCSKAVNDLEKGGYISKRPGVKMLRKKDLLYAWAYTSPIDYCEEKRFESLERPERILKEITSLGKQKEYAFTGLAGAEFIAPYVVPNEVHFYVTDEGSWEEPLKERGIYPSKKGNIHMLLGEKDVFYGLQDIKGTKVVSNPQLFVDLFSLNREAAEYLEEKVM